VAICEYVPPVPSLRSILNPVSLFELSAHARLICVAESATAKRLLGAAGGAGAVWLTLTSSTRNTDGRLELVVARK
jgi:hypothetical protein